MFSNDESLENTSQFSLLEFFAEMLENFVFV